MTAFSHLRKHIADFPKSQADDDQLDIHYAFRARIYPFVSHLVGSTNHPPDPHAMAPRVLFALSLLGADDSDDTNKYALRTDRWPVLRVRAFASAFGVNDNDDGTFATWVAMSRVSPLAAMDPLPWELLSPTGSPCIARMPRGVLGASYNVHVFTHQDTRDEWASSKSIYLRTKTSSSWQRTGRSSDWSLVRLVEFSAERNWVLGNSSRYMYVDGD
ncbi:hypothetical protein DFJ73DRAFT_764419 [Zopfochytrium polystomum]|nr:hypothetical protein DFJ73DRAFT_764419 [Zopfochytrium polystomum]